MPIACLSGSHAPAWEHGSDAPASRVEEWHAAARHALPVPAARGWHGPRLGALGVPRDAGASRLCSHAGAWEPEAERWRTTRGEVRAGLDDGCSWPLSHLKGLGRGLRRAGQPYLFAAEEGYLPGGMKRRVLRYLYVGDGAAPWPGTAA